MDPAKLKAMEEAIEAAKAQYGAMTQQEKDAARDALMKQGQERMEALQAQASTQSDDNLGFDDELKLIEAENKFAALSENTEELEKQVKEMSKEDIEELIKGAKATVEQLNLKAQALNSL